jgi:adenine phosphoribosyltransferase
VTDLEAFIRDVPDFPKPGILFKDLMPLFADPDAFRQAVDEIVAWARPRQPNVVLGAESRGFILGGAVARELGTGFVAARKPGKLPWQTVGVDYALEYGEARLELHEDAIKPGMRVLIHDDLLATGGTSAAKVRLVEQLGGVVAGICFLVELDFLHGRELLAGHDVHALVHYA